MDNLLQRELCQTLTGGEIFSRLPWSTRSTTYHRIAIAPLYPGLRRFKKGRGFSQWTGNDSKALMKVSGPHLLNAYNP